MNELIVEGPARVCALVKDKLEIPSDFDGVVFVPYDNGGWKLEIAKELSAAGISSIVAIGDTRLM